MCGGLCEADVDRYTIDYVHKKVLVIYILCS